MWSLLWVCCARPGQSSILSLSSWWRITEAWILFLLNRHTLVLMDKLKHPTGRALTSDWLIHPTGRVLISDLFIHPAWIALTSDWLINNFITIACENLFKFSPLVAIIAKYGLLTREWALLYQAYAFNEEAYKRGNPPWSSNPEQTSSEVQNRGISGPKRKTDVLHFFFMEKNISNTSFFEVCSNNVQIIRYDALRYVCEERTCKAVAKRLRNIRNKCPFVSFCTQIT